MNQSKLIAKVAFLIGYLIFASFSAYFTASSLSLNLLQGTNMWIVFVMVMVVALLAGWCLNNVIKELSKTNGASRTVFSFCLVGFLLFWAISFTTNVHYFFVQKHGFDILTKELASAKHYVQDNTSKSDRSIDDQRDEAKRSVTSQVQNSMAALEREINNTREHNIGFGDACITILKSTENILASDAQTYNDKNEYVIFDEKRDFGDRGERRYNRLSQLYAKYANRMNELLTRKLAVIDEYYEKKKNANTGLEELLKPIEELENKHLPAVAQDGSIDAFYKYCTKQNEDVISKMPAAYKDSCVVYKTKKEQVGENVKVVKTDEVKKYTVYPSQRMFDSIPVWGDILFGRLVGLTMLQWIIISLIFDVVSFILLYLFLKR